MRKFSAIIHLRENSPEVLKLIQSLGIADEVLVINHCKDDELSKQARQHGAKLIEAIDGVKDGAYASNASNDWLLALRPWEQISENLCAALKRWKNTDESSEDRKLVGYSVAVNGHRELRFVNRTRLNWTTELPASANNVLPLTGELLEAA